MKKSEINQKINKKAQEQLEAGRTEAFHEVLGDVFSDPVREGHYLSLQNRSSIRVANNDFGSGKATGNASRPSTVDFTVDVEKSIKDALMGLYNNPVYFEAFMNTWVYENDSYQIGEESRAEIIQAVGKTFLERGIAPVSDYFKVIRN